MLFVLLLYVVLLFGSNESFKLGNSLRVTFSSLLETTFVFPSTLGSCSCTRTTDSPSLSFSPPTMAFVPHCAADWIGFTSTILATTLSFPLDENVCCSPKVAGCPHPPPFCFSFDTISSSSSSLAAAFFFFFEWWSLPSAPLPLIKFTFGSYPLCSFFIDGNTTGFGTFTLFDDDDDDDNKLVAWFFNAPLPPPPPLSSFFFLVDMNPPPPPPPCCCCCCCSS